MCRYLVVLQHACVCVHINLYENTYLCTKTTESSNKRCKTQILKKCSKGDHDLILNCPIHTYSHVTSRSSVAAYLYFRTNSAYLHALVIFLLCHCLCLCVSLSLCPCMAISLCDLRSAKE